MRAHATLQIRNCLVKGLETLSPPYLVDLHQVVPLRAQLQT